MLRYRLCLLFLIAFCLLGANPNVTRRFRDASGRDIEEIKIPGLPPEMRNPGPIAVPSRSAVILSDVPKLDWSYGCTATSAAMIAGYYDRNGYPDMYTGPTNDGFFPPTNAAWGSGECSLSATHEGYDNLSGWGHADRFWTGYGNSGDDPYDSADPTSTYANCTADYIGTNQDYWNNSDGSSTLYNYIDGSPLVNFSGNENATPRSRDAIRGFRLFMESRGYDIDTNYNQYIYGHNGNTLGYTLSEFQQSIDSGIPVMIQVTGHTMVGVGYDSTSDLIYIHDTWDHNLHSMTWGGTYSDMQHFAVSVIMLASPPEMASITLTPGSFDVTLDTGSTTNRNLVVGNSGTGPLTYTCSLPMNDSTVLEEGFNATNMPVGWAQQQISGDPVNWEIAAGGYSNSPAGAHEGSYNARLFYGSYNTSTKMLITPALDLSDGATASLQFWHAQANWAGYQDELRVFYRIGNSGAWNLLAEYTESIPEWTHQIIDLPNVTANYYIAFEGTTQYGYGVCLDQVEVISHGAAIDWLTINGGAMVSGEIAAEADDHTLLLGFDTSGLDVGTYETNISLISNSDDNAEIDIPITLNVLGGLDAPQEPAVVLQTNGNVRVSWSAVSGNPNGYRVYFCADPSFSSNVSLLGTTARTRLYFDDTSAGSRPKGFYRIIAYRN